MPGRLRPPAQAPPAACALRHSCVHAWRAERVGSMLSVLARRSHHVQGISWPHAKIAALSACMRAEISCASPSAQVRPTSMSTSWNRALRGLTRRSQVEKTLSDFNIGTNGSTPPGAGAVGDFGLRRHVQVTAARQAARQPLQGRLMALQGRRSRSAAAAVDGDPPLGVWARRPGSSSAGRSAAEPRERVTSMDGSAGRGSQIRLQRRNRYRSG